ncbi:MAG: fructose-bisphosphate aldolase class I [Gammaproteobacteria bacterium]|nr:fructose-bisphosphate aldolase class I [Gammaproteobacteria bacterium]
MNKQELAEIANAMVARGKGILAIDESTPTIKKRFDSIGVRTSEDRRRAYRELLITAPIQDYISGVILYDETLRQSTKAGKKFAKVLSGAGILPGIKVDTGAKPLAGHPGELVTEGLDGLRERLSEYRRLGARFAKWRAVISIGGGHPSSACVSANAHALARYASLCQEASIVPIVEPEVLMDGDHSIEESYAVTSRVQREVFAALSELGVYLEGVVLKPSMVVPGQQCSTPASVAQVAELTVRCLRNAVPSAVPGIVFLSGGQSPEDASAHLNAMNASSVLPWALSFSYGRALQAPALVAWGGKAKNVAAAQAALAHRARLNSEASMGRYAPEMEAL